MRARQEHVSSVLLARRDRCICGEFFVLFPGIVLPSAGGSPERALGNSPLDTLRQSA